MTAPVPPTPPEPDSPEFVAALEWTTGEDERHVARTDDGWNLALFRYRAQGEAKPFPVVMGHGFAGSRYIFDAHPRYSMARALAARGYDVWLVDLRGRNDSWPDDGPDAALQWSFDDFVTYDIPAAVATACEVSGANEAWWIGTEVSGIALYAVVIAGTTRQVRGGVTLGSPAVTPSSAEVPGVTTPFPERGGTRYPFSMVREIGPQLAAQQSEFLESSFRPADTDWVVTARYFRYGVSDEATELADQFDDWITHGVMRTRDASVVYSDRLAEFTAPILVMAGAADRQRPVDATRATYDALGSSDKTWIRAGTADGWPIDVGHDDLLAGLCSPDWVYPRIADWLDARS